jgi:F-type H+-transporting ATPase subunit a
VEGFHKFLTINLNGINFSLTLAVVEQWAIMLIVMVLALLATRKLETIPKGAQAFGELIVGTVNSVVKSTMGEGFMNFAPYIGTLMIYLLTMNIFGITGFEPPTSDYSVALALALVSFFVIQATAIRRHGVGGYLIAYTKPLGMLTPLNIIERVVVPVSLSLRLFGNIFAAAVLMKLVRQGLAFASNAAHLGISTEHFTAGIFQVFIPLPLNLYFDVFDGAIQMVIFSMLTMIFIKTTSEH